MAPRPRRSLTRPESLVLLAAGAVGGLVLGVVVADRFGGLEGLSRRLGGARGRRHRDDGWRGDERRSQPLDAQPDDPQDDHAELAPEAIAHLHLHGRHPEPAVRGRQRERRATVGREELERRVYEAFRHDPMLASTAIDISALRGEIVELTGWVGEPAIVARAETIARGVPGVREVRSALMVRSGA